MFPSPLRRAGDFCARAIPELLYPVLGEHAFQACMPRLQKGRGFSR